VTLRWRLLTPAGRPGALAAISIEAEDDAELDAWLARLRLFAAPGGARLRSLLGVDDGLILRVSPREVILTPHGGVQIVRQVGSRLEESGVARVQDGRAPWPEATTEIEAWILEALATAPSPLAIETLLEQGRRWVGRGVDRLPEPGAAQQATDASEAEVPAAAAARLRRLLFPPAVAIVGPPNIGKSALLNRLARRAVSVVADEPGTTRDHVGVLLDCAGLVVRVLDAPGLRTGAGSAEAEAQDLAREVIAAADLLLMCFDAAAGPRPLNLPAPRDPGQQRLMIATRADLAGAGSPAWRADVVTSAQTGAGVEALAGAIREALLPAADLTHPGRWLFWSGGDHSS
jgi:hypothetical protein